MFRVVRGFTDLQDDNHYYKIGDTYPREGSVHIDRVRYLASADNKYGEPFIEEVINVLTEEDLFELTTKEIKHLAEQRGYTITKGNRNDVIQHFLEQQSNGVAQDEDGV